MLEQVKSEIKKHLGKNQPSLNYRMVDYMLYIQHVATNQEMRHFERDNTLDVFDADRYIMKLMEETLE